MCILDMEDDFPMNKRILLVFIESLKSQSVRAMIGVRSADHRYEYLGLDRLDDETPRCKTKWTTMSFSSVPVLPLTSGPRSSRPPGSVGYQLLFDVSPRGLRVW